MNANLKSFIIYLLAATTGVSIYLFTDISSTSVALSAVVVMAISMVIVGINNNRNEALAGKSFISFCFVGIGMIFYAAVISFNSTLMIFIPAVILSLVLVPILVRSVHVLDKISKEPDTDPNIEQ